jgi:endonuclease III
MLPKPKIKTSIVIDPEVWRAAKMIGAVKGKTASEVVEEAIARFAYSKIPRAERKRLAEMDAYVTGHA